MCFPSFYRTFLLCLSPFTALGFQVLKEGRFQEAPAPKFIKSLSMFSLLLCVSLTSNANDGEDLVNFIAATQIQTSEAYARLSYKANATSHAYVRELNSIIPIHSKYTVSKRGQTSLVTKTLLTTFTGGDLSEPKSPFKVCDIPVVKILLQTTDYTILWSNVAVPSVDIYFADDWIQDNASMNSEIRDLYGSVQIQRLCFGLTTPLHELIPKSPFAQWSATEVTEPNSLKVQRLVRGKDQQSVSDLDLFYDSQRGTLMKAAFMPAGGETASSVSIHYSEAELNGKSTSVPVEYKRESGMGDRRVSTSIAFSSHADESAMPPYSAEQMGMPTGTSISRRLPSSPGERKVWDGKNQTIEEWRTTK